VQAGMTKEAISPRLPAGRIAADGTTGGSEISTMVKTQQHLTKAIGIAALTMTVRRRCRRLSPAPKAPQAATPGRTLARPLKTRGHGGAVGRCHAASRPTAKRPVLAQKLMKSLRESNHRRRLIV